MADARPLIDWVPEGGLADPDAILDRFSRWADDRGLELYDAQEEALLELMTNHHVVLSTPTGSSMCGLERPSRWRITARTTRTLMAWR